LNQNNEKLCRRIAYEFKNRQLLDLALTHRSASYHHNERAEYLGDSVLNFVIAEALYHQFPKATEGELSRYRASLVKKDTLAEIARELDLGEFIKLGSGELKSGGYRRASILADALEALLAAVLIDSGFESAKSLILRLFREKLEKVSQLELKDPKSQLQEYLQSNKLALPSYEVTNIEGDPHQQSFIVICDITPLNIKTHGKGTSRRRAEQDAAQAALLEINKK